MDSTPKPRQAVPSIILRVLALVPIGATFVVSVAMMIYGSAKTAKFIYGLAYKGVGDQATHNMNLFTAIEIVDVFLLATVIQVTSVGLYQLYFNSHMALPDWLIIRSLDDLKSKLINVVITMLGISFLGRVLIWEKGLDIAYLGGAIALVVGALTLFLREIKGK